MENSQSAHKIKQRKSPRDVFITPTELALSHIKWSMGHDIDSELYKEFNIGTKVLDPCCYSINGSYIKTLRDLNFDVDYCEITMGKDFLEYTGREDGEDTNVIIGNPPYSFLDKWLEKSVEFQPQIISYLIGQGNLTSRRIEFMNKNGYSLTKCKMLKVYKWYGMSYLVHFQKRTEIGLDGRRRENCIEIEDVRKVWK